MLPSLLPLGPVWLLLLVRAAQAGPAHSHVPRQLTGGVLEGDDTVEVSLASGDSINVYLHGATVTSWRSSSGDEKLFLSEASALDGSAPIRGGIPVVFPNFGSPPADGPAAKLPSHGFARNSTWALEPAGRMPRGDGERWAAVRFRLDSAALSEDYRTKWPYSVSLTYTLNLTQDNLNVTFRVENTDAVALDFQFLLHTYLSVPDINATSLVGLQDTLYQDKTQDYKVVTEEAAEVRFTGETDRIYIPPAVAPVLLLDGGRERVTVDRSTTLPDVVVWNAWEEKVNTTADFAPKDAWQRYLAIEPGSVAEFTSLPAGAAWQASVYYKAHV